MNRRMLAFAATLLALALASVQAVEPGANAGVALQALTDAKDNFIAIVFEELTHLTLPDVSFDGGKLYNIVLEMHTPPQPSDVVVSLDESTNQVKVDVKGITADIRCDYKYKLLFITTKGHVKAKVKSARLTSGGVLGLMAREDRKLGPGIGI